MLIEEIGDILKDTALGYKARSGEARYGDIMKMIKEQFSLFKRLLKDFNNHELMIFAKNYETIKSKIKGNNALEEKLISLSHHIILLNNQLLILNL